MIRRAYPALCLRDGMQGLTRAEVEAHYASKGFKVVDSESDWTLMRNGVLEAYIRPSNAVRVGWTGSVVQLAPA